MPLTDEAKKLIKDEYDALTKEQLTVLTELRIYQWLGRLFFTAVLGGTILGIWKLQDYLDIRIAARNDHYEDVYFGVAMASQAPEEAATRFAGALSTLEEPIFKPSESFRAQYYFFFIRALAESYAQAPDGSFAEKLAWDQLTSSKLFMRDKVRHFQEWTKDSLFCNLWAHCMLKYQNDKDVLDGARDYFQKALDLATFPRAKSSNCLAIALLDIIDGKDDDAIQMIKDARYWNAATTNNLTGEAAPDLQREYQMFNLAAKSHGKNFDQLYKRFIEKVNAPKKK
jgi:hypothetical protein